MKELRFHRGLYSEAAIAEAIGVFEGYASLVRTDGADHVVVQVSGASPARETRVAGELANFALGVSVRDQGAAR